MAAHVIGRDEFFARENRADLGIERVEGALSERLRHCHLNTGARLFLLGFDQNEDRDVLWMRVRPLPHFLQASGEGLAGAAVVDVLHVHDFEAGLVHDVVRIKGGIRRQTGSFHDVRTVGMRVTPPWLSAKISSSIWRTPLSNCWVRG